jgi:hypothetical protein
MRTSYFEFTSGWTGDILAFPRGPKQSNRFRQTGHAIPVCSYGTLNGSAIGIDPHGASDEQTDR